MAFSIPFKRPLFLILIFSFHFYLSFQAAQNLSPTWDEIAYAPAGLAQLETGAITLNTVNPFLSKLIYGFPLWVMGATLPYDHSSWEKKDAYRFGFQFFFRNEIPHQKLILWSRLPVTLFSGLVALLLFVWTKSVWGWTGGIVTLASYVLTPLFLSRASVSQLEMPMYFFMLLSLWSHFCWFELKKYSFLILSGVTGGLAFLCKLTSLPLIPAFFLLEIFFHPNKPPLLKRFGHFFFILFIMGFTFLLAYLPWTGNPTALHDVLVNVIQFDEILPYYWAGRVSSETPALLSWPAFFIKAPLQILILSLIGGFLWAQSKQSRNGFLHFFFLGLCSFCSVFFFKNAVSTVQLSPTYLGLVGLASGLSLLLNKTRVQRAALIWVCFLVGVIDILAVHPNTLAYFNILVGGPNQGSRWLADSDQDWGQSLPALASYLKKSGNPTLILCYSGSGDPKAYGIDYQDLFSPALVSKERPDRILNTMKKPIYLAVGTKVLQSYGESFEWLRKNVQPIKLVGQCFFIYDITDRSDVFEWMGEFYRDMNRLNHARWAFDNAKGPREAN